MSPWILLEVVQVDKQECQCRQALLPVDDEVLAVLVADDDRAEEVMPVLFDLLAGVPLLVVGLEATGEVVDQLRHLLVLPAVLALVVVDGVLRAAE